MTTSRDDLPQASALPAHGGVRPLQVARSRDGLPQLPAALSHDSLRPPLPPARSRDGLPQLPPPLPATLSHDGLRPPLPPARSHDGLRAALPSARSRDGLPQFTTPAPLPSVKPHPCTHTGAFSNMSSSSTAARGSRALQRRPSVLELAAEQGVSAGGFSLRFSPPTSGSFESINYDEVRTIST